MISPLRRHNLNSTAIQQLCESNKPQDSEHYRTELYQEATTEEEAIVMQSSMLELLT